METITVTLTLREAAAIVCSATESEFDNHVSDACVKLLEQIEPLDPDFVQTARDQGWKF